MRRFTRMLSAARASTLRFGAEPEVPVARPERDRAVLVPARRGRERAGAGAGLGDGDDHLEARGALGVEDLAVLGREGPGARAGLLGVRVVAAEELEPGAGGERASAAAERLRVRVAARA